MPRSLSVAAALVLIGCGQSPVETKRSMAEFACLTRSLAQQGYGKIGPDGAFSESGSDVVLSEEAGEKAPFPPGSSVGFRFVSSGQFVFDYGEVKLMPPHHSYTLTCTGDFNAGILTSVRIDGVIHRPEAGKLWRF